MAITQSICNVFFYDLARGLHNFSSDVIKIALYTSSADLGPTTTAYSATNETSGTGYVAGGATLTATLVGGVNNTVTYVDFADATWPSSTFTARGALVYNNTSGGSICVLDFGSDRSSSASTFRVTFPTANASDAIIRLSRSV